MENLSSRSCVSLFHIFFWDSLAFVIGSCAAHSGGSKVTDAGSSSVCVCYAIRNIKSPAAQAGCARRPQVPPGGLASIDIEFSN